jgi:hypothetical protein
MATKYQKFGLRADRNLTDLENRQEALANMLEGLAVDNDGYYPGDLLVINGLRNTEVTADDLVQVGNDNNLITYTPEDAPGENRAVQPLVRIIDRIENYKIITGTPNFVNGGDGPNSWFVPSNGITTDPITQASTGADILDINADGVIGPVDFWDNGVFKFGIKINDEFEDTYGGCQWEGWTSLTSFDIETTGLYIIEYDPYGTGYETVASIYAEERDITYISSATTNGQTSMIVDEDQIRFISIGDWIEENGQPVLIQSIDNDSGVVTFEGEITSLNAAGGTATLTFEMSADPVRSRSISLRSTFTGDTFKMRITCWWSNRGDGDRLPFKDFEFYDIDSERYPFAYFYKEKPNTTEPELYTYAHFAKYKASPLAQESTVALESSETISIQYIPPVNVSDKIKVTARDFEFDGVGKFLGSTSNIEVGDYLVDNNDTKAYQVFQIGSDSLWVNPTSWSTNNPSVVPGDTATFDVVSHLGLIDIHDFNAGAGATINVLDSYISGSRFEVKSDYLMAGNSNTKFKRITSVDDNTQVVGSIDIHGVQESYLTSSYVLVYANSGLKDLSSEVQCQGIFGKEATAQSTTNTLTVSDTNGISVGDYVQYLTGSSATNRLADNTQVTQINGNVLSIDTNVIGTIEAGATLVFIPQSVFTGGNMEYCVLPLNTAPPFAGTTDGLATTASFPNIKFNGVKFTNLKINNVTAADNSDFSVSEHLVVEHDGTEYRMLIK